MWIFGQVWFACLVGFAVGVLLDWVVRVRPLSNRVAELEARLAAGARSARQDGEYGRSVFDRGPFATAALSADGFVANRNRGGLLTPSGSLGGTDLLADTDDEGESRSGVEDFPGVARISEAWEEEAEEATRAAPAPWQPGQPSPAVEQAWRPERPAESTDLTSDWLSDEPAAEQTSITPWRSEPEPAEPPAPLPPVSSNSDADAQYLDFLRAGAGGPATADTDDDRDLVTHGEVVDPGATDVTSVLPQIEGYEAYESYADEYEYNGERSGQLTGEYGDDSADNGFHFGDYSFEDVDEPAESSTPLPRREVSGEPSLRFAAFESPFHEGELVDVQRPRAGELTPIEEGGFQPFQKPALVDGHDGRWLGDQPYAAEAQPSTNGSHVLTDDTTSTNLFEPEGWHRDGPVTQRILPVSRPDVEHPDLLRESVFGTETDTIYEDEADGSRSLFEPLIPPEAAAEGYQSYEDGFLPDLTDVPPGYGEPPAPEDEPRAYEEQPGGYDDRPGPNETTDEFATDGFLDAPPAPRPVRVRTGVDGPATQVIPIPPDPPADRPPTEPVDTPQPAGQDDGPFGPGSALPKPDGSAPSPQFQVKARTSSMVFHTSSSPFFDRLEPQVWFRTPEDAQRAGFTSWERPHNY